jgi:hypothetical protein
VVSQNVLVKGGWLGPSLGQFGSLSFFLSFSFCFLGALPLFLGALLFFLPLSFHLLQTSLKICQPTLLHRTAVVRSVLCVEQCRGGQPVVHKVLGGFGFFGGVVAMGMMVVWGNTVCPGL